MVDLIYDNARQTLHSYADLFVCVNEDVPYHPSSDMDAIDPNSDEVCTHLCAFLNTVICGTGLNKIWYIIAKNQYNKYTFAYIAQVKSNGIAYRAQLCPGTLAEIHHGILTNGVLWTEAQVRSRSLSAPGRNRFTGTISRWIVKELDTRDKEKRDIVTDEIFTLLSSFDEE